MILSECITKTEENNAFGRKKMYSLNNSFLIKYHYLSLETGNSFNWMIIRLRFYRLYLYLYTVCVSTSSKHGYGNSYIGYAQQSDNTRFL